MNAVRSYNIGQLLYTLGNTFFYLILTQCILQFKASANGGSYQQPARDAGMVEGKEYWAYMITRIKHLTKFYKLIIAIKKVHFYLLGHFNTPDTGNKTPSLIMDVSESSSKGVGYVYY